MYRKEHIDACLLWIRANVPGVRLKEPTPRVICDVLMAHHPLCKEADDYLAILIVGEQEKGCKTT